MTDPYAGKSYAANPYAANRSAAEFALDRSEGMDRPSVVDSVAAVIDQMTFQAKTAALAGLPAALLSPPPELAEGRSPEWERVRREHLAARPVCEACGNPNGPEVHHVFPFHLYPKWELEPWNLFTLCRVHHLVFGHLMDWKNYNPWVILDAGAYRERFAANLNVHAYSEAVARRMIDSQLRTHPLT
jgi:hypothetical protein